MQNTLMIAIMKAGAKNSSAENVDMAMLQSHVTVGGFRYISRINTILNLIQKKEI